MGDQAKVGGSDDCCTADRSPVLGSVGQHPGFRRHHHRVRRFGLAGGKQCDLAVDHVRGGGDGYKIFATNSQNAYDYGPGLEQVVADYIAANQPYKPYVAGRIIEGDGFDVAAATTQEASSGEVTLSGEVTAAGAHIIVEGDNLWNLAKKKYGDATQWPVLKDANRIDNVHGLQIGDVLKVPEQQ